MRKAVFIVLRSIVLAIIFLILVFASGRFFAEKSNVPGVGSNPIPQYWSKGLPLPFIDYSDCLAGCVPVLDNVAFLVVDFMFWFLIFVLCFMVYPLLKDMFVKIGKIAPPN